MRVKFLTKNLRQVLRLKINGQMQIILLAVAVVLLMIKNKPATIVVDISSKARGVLGTLELQLMTLEEGEEGWFTVSHSKMSESSGEIYIQYNYRLPYRDTEKERQATRPSIVMMDPNFEEKPEFVNEDPNELVVKVLRAKGVLAADKSLLRRLRFHRIL